MSKIITAQMMSDLPYTCENQAPLQKVENTKNINDVVKVYDIVFKNHNASAILNKIKENIDELAAIESEENHVPLIRAKQAFAKAVALQPIASSLIQDNITENTLQLNLRATRHYTILSLIKGIMLGVIRKYPNIIVDVDSRREKLVNYLAKILEWDMKYKSEYKPHVSPKHFFNGVFSMFIFRSSDLEAATDHLSQAIGDPSGKNRVREVYVQESALCNFKAKLQRKLRCYSPEVLNDPLLRQSHDEIEKILKKLNASTIRPLNAPEGEMTPVVCYEFDMSYFPPDSPVVILKVFRTAKEAVSLATKDCVCNASIWTESLALAYELVNSLDGWHFWINCLGANCKMWTELSMLIEHTDERTPFEKLSSGGVSVENSYHFEYFEVNGLPKFVAFPFGVSFAN